MGACLPSSGEKMNYSDYYGAQTVECCPEIFKGYELKG